uniref:Protein kinase domain-containing protein n=1 Tax=Bursaphelenchus xylophilus TaxID=6326 RepID=A0A1I7SPD0_BURXY
RRDGLHCPNILLDHGRRSDRRLEQLMGTAFGLRQSSPNRELDETFGSRLLGIA